MGNTVIERTPLPRPKAIEPNLEIHTTLPPRLATRVKLYLWSEVESGVPRGALQRFLVDLITKFFNHRRVDLGVFMGRLPGEIVVEGSEHSINTLVSFLKEVTSNDTRNQREDLHVATTLRGRDDHGRTAHGGDGGAPGGAKDSRRDDEGREGEGSEGGHPEREVPSGRDGGGR